MTARTSDDALRQLAALVEASEDAIIGSAPDGTILSWNAGAERLYGYSAAEAVGRPATLLAPPDRVGEVIGQLAALRAGRSLRPLETVRLRKDGTPVHVSLSAAPLRGPDGSVVGASSIARDITGRRALEERLRQAQKMEAVGRLAGGVAHDFNNLLTVINGCGELLQRELPPDGSAAVLLRELRRAGERAAGLTRQLLAFSRKQVLHPVPLGLNDVVREMADLLRRLTGEDVALDVKLGPALGCVRVDPGQIEQVLLNLVVNARDATPPGGKVTVATADAEVDEAAALPHPDARPGPYVVLSVGDTGCGMDEATRARIFEPFFTTKGPGKGTGLGLAVVHGIVQQSGGFIDVQSAEGRGSTFRVHLPRLDAGVVPDAPAAAELHMPGGSETVLVAEDEDGVRWIERLVLASCGYAVLEARDAEEALRLAGRHAGPLHLLVTDVVMPGLDGRQLADRLAAQVPGLRVLFVSGYAGKAVLARGVTEEGAGFLQKPFTPIALARKVREVLDAPAPG
jgi:PAS domain S-box-containing protein